jgi:hypothetical protein
MKRLRIALPSLAILLALSLSSCEQMFSTNLFAKWTHPVPSAADMGQKTPEQLKDYIGSSANLTILIENPDLKQAAIDSLTTAYVADISGASGQTAAIVAADIEIQTVPEAAGLSSSILGALVGGSSVPTIQAEVAPFVKTVLPPDIAASLGSPTPPAAFTAMIDAFIGANAAYVALGTEVQSAGYASGLGLSSAETASIAVNAVISGLVSAIVPAGPCLGFSVADALWAAINGTSAAITVSSSAISELTSGSYPIASLVNASSLGSILGGS